MQGVSNQEPLRVYRSSYFQPNTAKVDFINYSPCTRQNSEFACLERLKTLSLPWHRVWRCLTKMILLCATQDICCQRLAASRTLFCTWPCGWVKEKVTRKLLMLYSSVLCLCNQSANRNFKNIYIIIICSHLHFPVPQGSMRSIIYHHKN